MAKGVFVHRADSKYDDFPEERYQFPGRYLNRARKFEGDWIVYYEPRGGGGRMGYNAIAKIESIDVDLENPEMYVAHIDPTTFRQFEEFVPSRTSDGFMESDLRKLDGSLNKGLIQWAVRPISDADFNAILMRGFGEEVSVLPRHQSDASSHAVAGFGEDSADFVFDSGLVRVEQTIARIPRDRAFRKHVLEAYDSRCALTGLKLINGGGRAEVEAAHIKPVSDRGPDTVRNGIALSGTVHWMFDRGLVGLSDELDILVSRQANDPDQIWDLVNDSGKAIAPADPALRPHPKFLEWHRDNYFKG
ncbi:HNH endonuclease [Pyruvatibacter sp.]|nr:HNH endonuclease [Alphaproteobacteria bacterium]